MVIQFSCAGCPRFKEADSPLLPGQKPLHPKEGSKLPLMKPERGMVLHSERKLEGHPDTVLGPRKKAGEGKGGEGKLTLKVHTSQHLLPPCHTCSVYFLFSTEIYLPKLYPSSTCNLWPTGYLHPRMAVNEYNGL